ELIKPPPCNLSPYKSDHRPHEDDILQTLSSVDIYNLSFPVHLFSRPIMTSVPTLTPPPISQTYSTSTEGSSTTGTSTFSRPDSATSPLTSPSTDHSFSGPDNDIIPTSHPARTLVLCFDGTGDQFDSDNSNVIQFFSLLKKGDRRQQMVYYQAGIGTYTVPEVATPMMAKFEKTMDEMIAWNLDAHVMGGYEFLMQNYEAGDKICLFGFSRGAYTARALAGMIHKVGLLPACNHQQIPFAYKMFTKADEKGWKQSTAFKKAFSMDVDIEFIGVWDTVCSVGLIPRRLPFTSSNTAIRTFRHALSLDEHRAKFKANLYNIPTKRETQLGTQPGDMPKTGGAHKPKHPKRASLVSRAFRRKWRSTYDPALNLKKAEQEFDNDSVKNQTDVLEVWFAGCHCDVGGGSVSNDETRNLARIPLRWMIRQCFLTNTGIRFHSELLKTVGIDPATLHPVPMPRPLLSHSREISTATGNTLVDAPNEDEEDKIDALCPIFDQLKLAYYWWILEVIPIRHRVQCDDNEWKREWTMNLGAPREIPHHHKPIRVHKSVKMRMEAQNLPGGPYKPKAEFRHKAGSKHKTEFKEPHVIWVD
ncbi:hypothetical protein A0H81_01440, partial [Grifola frondosa]